MNDDPGVSTIIIFLDTEAYLEEAIKSVLNQTCTDLELILVDDGSRDGSTTIAQSYADQYPNKVRYLEHPAHQNCGKGASRNLGIAVSRGEIVAFLDADDVWLPQKLEQQTEILASHPEAGMLYGNTLYWYGWTNKPEDARRDFLPDLRVRQENLIEPLTLLPLFLRGKAAVPSASNMIVRRSILNGVGGFEEDFTGISNIYEDQAFYAKVCLNYPVIVSNQCWDKYRQHPTATTAVAKKMDQEIDARKFYLSWLRGYLRNHGIQDQLVWQALRQEEWRLHFPGWLPSSQRMRYILRWVKKWLLKIDDRLVLAAIDHRIWGPD